MASGSQDDASATHETPSIAGDSAKLLGGKDYRTELTEALRRQGVLDQDARVSETLKERDKYRHYLEKEFKAISARIEQEEAKLQPSSHHSSVSSILHFSFVKISFLLPCFLLHLLSSLHSCLPLFLAFDVFV